MENTKIKNIRSLLDTTSDKFARLGIFQKLNLKNADKLNAYIFQRQSFASQYPPEIILLQQNNKSNILTALELLEKQWPKTNNWQKIYIDCFSKNIGKTIPDLTTIVSPEEFWKILIDIDDYIKSLNTELAIENINELFLNRRICQLILEDDGMFKYTKKRDVLEYFTNWACQSTSEVRNILLVGERGSGKTWILKYFAKVQYEMHKERIWEVPPAIYIDLHDYAKYLLKAQGLEKSLAYYLCVNSNCKSAGEIYFCNTLIESGQLILLLDGFDELSKEYIQSDLKRHLQVLADYLPTNCKAIISSRSSRFPSLRKLYDLFASGEIAWSSQSLDRTFYAPSALSRPYIPEFNIFNIHHFEEDDFESLTIKNKLSFKTNFDNIYERVQSILNWETGNDFITKQCCELASIPTCAQEMLNFIDEGIENNLHLFEMSLLDPLIVYNIETDRALVDYGYKKTEDAEPEVATMDFKKRLEVLEHIAWHLMETGKDDFDPSIIGYTFLNIPITQFETLVNDMRSQTVFDLFNNTSKLKFRLPVIQAYFTSRYIYSKLTNEKERLTGVKCLGRHDLSGSIMGETIAGFLVAFMTFGMVTPWEDDYFDIDLFITQPEDYINVINRDKFNTAIFEVLAKEPIYSPWTHYLGSNLNKILGHSDIIVTEFAGRDEWQKNYLEIINNDGILITASEKLKPYIISRREVTNEEFTNFLKSEWIPQLESVYRDRIYPVKIDFKKRDSNCVDSHPLSWNAIHRPIEETDQRYKFFTNDYHLFEWIDGKCPEHLIDHPAVWLSAYIIAIYCNWMTFINYIQMHAIKEEKDINRDNIDYYYNILLEDEKQPQINCINNSIGFRMPTIEEWQFAAKAGDSYSNPWESMIKSDDMNERKKGKLLKSYLLEPIRETKSVMTSVPNAFGIYGMIGNVREWTHKTETQANNLKMQHGQIMGATWALGENTFIYDFPGSSLPKINTNLDVGFRWARSISSDDEKKVSQVKIEKMESREKK